MYQVNQFTQKRTNSSYPTFDHGCNLLATMKVSSKKLDAAHTLLPPTERTKALFVGGPASFHIDYPTKMHGLLLASLKKQPGVPQKKVFRKDTDRNPILPKGTRLLRKESNVELVHNWMWATLKQHPQRAKCTVEISGRKPRAQVGSKPSWKPPACGPELLGAPCFCHPQTCYLTMLIRFMAEKEKTETTNKLNLRSPCRTWSCVRRGSV